MKKPIVVLCSSAAFYEKVNRVAAQVEKLGFTAVVPRTARTMAEENDYDVTHYKTWYDNEADYSKKADYMRWHFDEVENGDMVLVVNEQKHGIENYIGPNVLMEMGIAFHFSKPIYLLNDFPEDSPFIEEIKGMGSIPLHNNLAKLQMIYRELTAK